MTRVKFPKSEITQKQPTQAEIAKVRERFPVSTSEPKWVENSPFSQYPGQSDNWARVQEIVRFENELINHRMTWVLSLQGLLIGSFWIAQNALYSADMSDAYYYSAQGFLAALIVTTTVLVWIAGTGITFAYDRIVEVQEWWSIMGGPFASQTPVSEEQEFEPMNKMLDGLYPPVTGMFDVPHLLSWYKLWLTKRRGKKGILTWILHATDRFFQKMDYWPLGTTSIRWIAVVTNVLLLLACLVLTLTYSHQEPKSIKNDVRLEISEKSTGALGAALRTTQSNLKIDIREDDLKRITDTLANDVKIAVDFSTETTDRIAKIIASLPSELTVNLSERNLRLIVEAIISETVKELPVIRESPSRVPESSDEAPGKKAAKDECLQPKS